MLKDQYWLHELFFTVWACLTIPTLYTTGWFFIHNVYFTCKSFSLWVVVLQFNMKAGYILYGNENGVVQILQSDC